MKTYKTGYQILNNKLEVVTRFKSFNIAVRFIDKLRESENLHNQYFIFNIKTSKSIEIL